MRKNDLTPKQESFCIEYLKCGNASEAYRSVYKPKNSKSVTINRNAKKLLDNGKIATRLQEIQGDVAEKAAVDAAKVLEWLVEIKEMNVLQVLNDDWTLKPLREWPKVWLESITAMDIQEIHAGQTDSEVAISYLKKMRWADKSKNMEMIGKAVGAFNKDRSDQGVIPTMPVVIEIVGGKPRSDD